MAELNLFIPLTKADAKRRLVYGVVTAETPDRGNEICDYATTKPYYQKWSAEFLKASGGKSLGNLRAMHGKVAAGRLEAITFNDEARQIEICAKIVDDAEWRKVEAGVYTGFSQGGGYVRRWPDSDDPRLTRYTANPSEISLVDLPALPSATFSLIKLDGVAETQRFAEREEMSEVEQVWMAQDGKTFKKKAEALAHQMALSSMGPMLSALGRAESDVDDVRLASQKRCERDRLTKFLSEQALDAARAVAALEIVFDILNNALDDDEDAAESVSALAEAIEELKQFIASLLLAQDEPLAQAAGRKDLVKALEETQLDRYRYKDRIGVSSRSLGGQETTAYQNKPVPDFVAASLVNFRRIIANCTMLSVEIDGADTLAERFEKLPDKIRQALAQKSEELAQRLEQKVKDNLSGAVLQGRSGALRNSIEMTLEPFGATLAARTKYAAAQEYGFAGQECTSLLIPRLSVISPLADGVAPRRTLRGCASPIISAQISPIRRRLATIPSKHARRLRISISMMRSATASSPARRI